MKKTAIAYYRKSIEREAEKSIEGQREEVRRYAMENNIEIVSEYEEVASSMTTDREKLNLLFKDLESNKNIDYILVHRFDRMTRDILGMGYVMSILKKGKTRLHSVTEENDYEGDPTKLMMIMMKTYGASMERIAIVERMQGARKRKKDKGGFIGGTPPMGYKAILGTGKLEIEEKEVPIVKDTFYFREKGMTMQKIADKLNEKGYKTRKNKDFYPTTVQRILKHRSWYEGEGQAPAIL